MSHRGKRHFKKLLQPTWNMSSSWKYTLNYKTFFISMFLESHYQHILQYHKKNEKTVSVASISEQVPAVTFIYSSIFDSSVKKF